MDNVDNFGDNYNPIGIKRESLKALAECGFSVERMWGTKNHFKADHKLVVDVGG